MIFLLRKRRRITISNFSMMPQRLTAIRSAMSERRLEALLVHEPAHVRYVTGFTGSNGICILTPQEQFFITDRRYQTQAPQEVHDFEIFVASHNLYAIIKEKALIPRRAKIGFEHEYVSVADIQKLRKLLPGRKFIPATDIIETVSAIKDDGEIPLIRHAAQITDKVFKKILSIIRPGVRECEIAAEISYWHRRFGAESDAFEPIVASGERGAQPHARASDKIIQRGEMVVLDFGCRYSGYHSDLTRTIAIGKPAFPMRKVYAAVLAAQKKAIEAIHAGVTARRIDSIARNHIRRAGFGKYFFHSLGHGIGIHIHEALRLSTVSPSVLAAGNVTTVEPGIYIPDLGGVRIEDDIVVRENGCDVLTASPRELMIV